VDLIFYATDEEGAAAPIPAHMARFDASGSASSEDEIGRPVRLFFDTARNWALVRALLEDGRDLVTRIFISAPLRRRLLDYARISGEPPSLCSRAEAILSQPGDSTPHDDHMHVRIRGDEIYSATALRRRNTVGRSGRPQPSRAQHAKRRRRAH
jgi:penicillin-insensitive murein endopeptidase